MGLLFHSDNCDLASNIFTDEANFSLRNDSVELIKSEIMGMLNAEMREY